MLGHAAVRLAVLRHHGEAQGREHNQQQQRTQPTAEHGIASTQSIIACNSAPQPTPEPTTACTSGGGVSFGAGPAKLVRPAEIPGGGGRGGGNKNPLAVPRGGAP